MTFLYGIGAGVVVLAAVLIIVVVWKALTALEAKE